MQNDNDVHSQLLRYGIDIGFLISGFCGAVLLTIKKRKQKIRKSIACIVAGTLCANFLTPLVLNFAPKSIQENGKYAVAFMMGYMGLKGLEIIVDIIEAYIDSKTNKT
jgi:presenilin-like A22 family membrane protease